jgi:hypothetical protein
MNESDPIGSTPRPVSSRDVHQRERLRHLGKTEDEPLVALALSGGGIRSATFALGLLQAFQSFGLLRARSGAGTTIDYLSTVSGGGYIGGWLQGALARGRMAAALVTNGSEPREIRFLRAHSNYLTPRLGLFSGDTWAAVGTSLRNLLLTFTILSLSLFAPLYLPWLVATLFWRLVPDRPESVGMLVVAGILLAMSVAVSTLNLARPLKDGTWSRAGRFRAVTWQVELLVVFPTLLAVGCISTVAWAWAAHHLLEKGTQLWSTVIAGGIAHGLVWLVGLTAGFLLSGRKSKSKPPAPTTDGLPPIGDVQPGVDLRRAMSALVVLVVTAAGAGCIGTFAMSVSSQAFVSATGGRHAWLTGLFLFPIGIASLLLCVTAHIGLAGKRFSDETREWWGRVGGSQLLATLLLMVLGVLGLAGPKLFGWIASQTTWVGEHETLVKSILGAIWGAATGAGILAGRSARTSSTTGPSPLESVGRIAPFVFLTGYLLLLSTVLYASVPNWFPLREPSRRADQSFAFSDLERVLQNRAELARSSSWAGTTEAAPVTARISGPGAPGGMPDGASLPWFELPLLLMLFVTGAIAWFLSWRVDLNEFSLHAFYRNRLVRSYLGASHANRDPHPFTGFDPDDDLALTPSTEQTKGLQAPIRPYPIFNVALNLVGGKNLAWQERKAASFVFTPEYCGFEYRADGDKGDEPEGSAMLSAYAPTGDHACDPSSLTVGLAVATSGAAASPNMGYHTSPTLAFLMTVFNVRLGWWLRNPRWSSVWTDQRTGLSLRELLYELLGMTTDDRSWIYLSDGGHFENLGIYELVRRRCRFIIVSDAGQDGAVTFADLGNAIEKCRADFGVDIEISLDEMRPGAGTRFSNWHCAIGTIRYDRQNPREASGTLVYIKSSLTGDEPADVLRYAALHPSFPHQSTNDQFFDESQFESYRALGYHVACQVFSAGGETSEIGTLAPVELFMRLRQHWARSAPGPQEGAVKYSEALSKIWATVRTTPQLRFLDGQMFPEWFSLTRTGVSPSATEALPTEVNYWLPETPEERRLGFYICSDMLQLMENVYREFKLDDNYDHIDNRGWLNLFQHWSWSGMLCATWAITGSTHDPRFQRFCLRRLDLRTGLPYLTPGSAIPLPLPDEWRAGLARDATYGTQEMAEWQQDAGLNFLEAELVARFLSVTTSTRPLHLVPVRVRVESPRRSDGHPMDFNVGYLIADIDPNAQRLTLHHMRIQNHLRKMGLARAALAVIVSSDDPGWNMDLEVAASTPAAAVGDGATMDEALPSDASLVRVQRIVRSLPRRHAAVG